MKYLPLADSEKEDLLKEIGVGSIRELFRSIPDDLLLETAERFPSPLSEFELVEHFKKGRGATIRASFLGGAGHTHYIPSIIDPLVSRGEFLTAYTPYQPEVSQGTLQSMFEFQSMMAELMGVEVSNASLYDGSTAMIEACLMASRITGGDHILVSDHVLPEYLETLQTYIEGGVLNYSLASSTVENTMDQAALKRDLEEKGDRVAAVVVQSPNAYGLIEDIKKIKSTLEGRKTMLIVVVAEAISMGLLLAPGKNGADIVCGEAQSLGIPLSFGGPWLGFIGTSGKNVRALPGRIVGETVDAKGKVSYVVTLVAREQHIRREKATSNICTNQGLMSLRCAIYLSVMGPEGMKRAAERSHRFAVYGRKLLKEAGVRILSGDGPIFNEFVFETRRPARQVFDDLMKSHGIAGGNITGEKTIRAAFNETMNPELIELWAKEVSR